MEVSRGEPAEFSVSNEMHILFMNEGWGDKVSLTGSLQEFSEVVVPRGRPGESSFSISSTILLCLEDIGVRTRLDLLDLLRLLNLRDNLLGSRSVSLEGLLDSIIGDIEGLIIGFTDALSDDLLASDALCSCGSGCLGTAVGLKRLRHPFKILLRYISYSKISSSVEPTVSSTDIFCLMSSICFTKTGSGVVTDSWYFSLFSKSF